MLGGRNESKHRFKVREASDTKQIYKQITANCDKYRGYEDMIRAHNLNTGRWVRMFPEDKHHNCCSYNAAEVEMQLTYEAVRRCELLFEYME